MDEPDPRHALEQKIAALLREHAETGPPWRPDDLASELEGLIDTATPDELRLFESLGAATLLALAGRPGQPPV